MRRLRLSRRRDPEPESIDEASEDYEEEYTEQQGEFAPFVPVNARDDYDEYGDYGETPDSDSYYPEVGDESRRGRLPRLPRPRLPRLRIGRPTSTISVRFDVLLLLLLLIAGGIYGTVSNRYNLRDEIETWWPAVIFGVALLWMLGALFKRHIESFLGSTALAGVGLSLLLHTHAIASFEETLIGIILVTTGLGIVSRGFLLRQQAPV